MKKEKQNARKLPKTVYLDVELIESVDKYLIGIGKDRSFTWLVEQIIKEFMKSNIVLSNVK